MLSAVLMMALTTGGEVSDFGRKGGCGGCQGGCGGLFSGGGLFHGRRNHGCNGGCYGGGNGGCYGAPQPMPQQFRAQPTSAPQVRAVGVAASGGGGLQPIVNGNGGGGSASADLLSQAAPAQMSVVADSQFAQAQSFTEAPQQATPVLSQEAPVVVSGGHHQHHPHHQGVVVSGGCSGSFGGGHGHHQHHGVVIGGGCSGGHAGGHAHHHGGCYGGHAGGHAHHHGGCYGGHAHHHHGVISGGCGGTIISITPSKEEKKGKEDKKGKVEKGGNEEQDEVSEAPAKVVVSLPAEATLKIDGQATKSTGGERTFVTPKLVKGGKYSWTLEVELMQDGSPVSWSQKVSLTPGETHKVSVTMPVSLAKK